jgi:hypothetical protein
MKKLFPFFFSLLVLSSAVLAFNALNDPPLIKLIEKVQRQYVRLSYSPQGCCCYTTEELDKFKKNKTIDKIVASLRKDKNFLKIVTDLRSMPKDQLTKALGFAAQTYHPTWAEIGEISPKGQTDAGQEAERLIAEAIVGLARELLGLKN